MPKTFCTQSNSTWPRSESVRAAPVGFRPKKRQVLSSETTSHFQPPKPIPRVCQNCFSLFLIYLCLERAPILLSFLISTEPSLTLTEELSCDIKSLLMSSSDLVSPLLHGLPHHEQGKLSKHSSSWDFPTTSSFDFGEAKPRRASRKIVPMTDSGFVYCKN